MFIYFYPSIALFLRNERFPGCFLPYCVRVNIYFFTESVKRWEKEKGRRSDDKIEF